jgi:3-hydroxyacyl-CoA dehydrogenase/enoyl-CoA hydratase/3-hydroxybutyryl-CoA epimerase
MLGFPVGPLQLVDETSLELGLAIARATRAAMGDAYLDSPADALLAEMVETHGRKGRKNGKGVYDYDERGKRLGFWPGLGEAHPRADPQPPLAEVQDRLMMIQALEAVRALEEGVLEDPRQGDVGAVLGWGFAPWSGGPFGWLDRIGAKAAAERADALAARFGPRFAPPALLHDMAARRERFHRVAA